MQEGFLPPIHPRIPPTIQRIKERALASSFDCLVGLSGGGDSTYLLHQLKTKHNLRCLAAYYRTPFTSDTTDTNVRTVTSRLEIPLIEMRISGDHHGDTAREFLLAWMKDQRPVIANMACAVCKFVNREVFRIAAVNNIKTVICGATPFEAVQVASSIPRNLVLTSKEAAANQFSILTQLGRTIMILKRGLQVLASSSTLWKYIPLGIKASIMYVSPHTPFLRVRYPSIEAFEYFYFAEWNEKELETVLLTLGWVLPPNCKTIWKSDCCFAELKNLMFRKMTGASYLDGFLSNMVRAGVLTRNEALKRLDIQGGASVERIAEACDVLKLSREQLKAILRLAQGKMEASGLQEPTDSGV